MLLLGPRQVRVRNALLRRPLDRPLKDEMGLLRKILVCTTERRARLGDVEVFPIQEFLAELPV